MLAAFVSGFALGLSLIVAIGAQNAFVLRQGLKGEHVFAVCLVCAASDAVLIVVGVGGFAALERALPGIAPAMTWGGAAFLAVYGALSFRRAFRSADALDPAAAGAGSLSAALAACLAFTWLNPHVYLDTVVLLGSVSAGYVGARAAFAAGGTLASFAFFFGLGYGARALRPLFARPFAWRVLETVVGITMWAIAWRLVHSSLSA